ncbi:unnamed protein product [Didymodactylos carnosus]|uniref:HAT C-terminal dimerisation domain-containing protein n=2 Tax=Didymodactylos carnosus TaxID=1234261 RepID=A0A8S2Y4N6_9BILA|nr:unnamed protein product [Didymodactylos carnosus]CAF4534540.1 unnamed protein product [Didymodactylos carnosus]
MDMVKDERDNYLQAAVNMKQFDNNPLKYWKQNREDYPMLSIISRQILVIQASSSESERHFSAGGAIVSETRSRLSPENVESLIVLRETYVNNMWSNDEQFSKIES